jgi:uncharacterized protein DUF6265
MRRTLALVLLLIVGAPWRAHAQSARLESVSWLIGCWELLASDQNQLVQESWGAPLGGSMLGMSRTVRDGKLIQFESIILRVEKGKLAYEAHPSGQPTATFLSTKISDKSILFENPQHDFPQKIGYELKDSSSLLAWIEGPVDGKPRRQEFPYRRVVCSER